jgi:hypothetical protein
MTTNLFLALSYELGSRTFSKVFCYFPANMYMDSKPPLMAVGSSKLIYIFTNILC